MPAAPYATSVFINCAFDEGFRPVFRAVIFAVLDCGFTPRSALEYQDSGEIRMRKIEKLIKHSRSGIHDISRVELDPTTHLPRFNMPYELGLFLGAKRFGSGRDRRKRCLIMDSDPHRYMATISDLRGLDPESHDNDPIKAITIVRNWLDHGRRKTARPLPGGDAISERYQEYQADLPQMAAQVQLSSSSLTYTDEVWLMDEWLNAARPDAGG